MLSIGEMVNPQAYNAWGFFVFEQALSNHKINYTEVKNNGNRQYYIKKDLRRY